VLGNNVRARTDSVHGIVVGNPHDYYGYRAITMSTDGIAFYGVTGKVAAGDPLANERMRITNDGNIGIGTTSPGYKLHIAGTSSTTPLIQVTPGSGLVSDTAYIQVNGRARFGYLGNTGIEISDSGSGWPILFSVLGSERVRINSSGNVGIGTTSPNDKLDVAGHINSSGSYKLDGVTILANPGTQKGSSKNSHNVADKFVHWIEPAL